MGDFAALELMASIEAWLAADGVVLAASERAARALLTKAHRAHQAQGETAWATPRILPWQLFLRQSWQQRSRDGRLVLTPLQEEALWATLVANEPQMALEGPRARMGKLAMEAHALLAAYAPEQFDPRARIGWQSDQASFSRWLADFDQHCAEAQILSSARLPLELLRLLEAEPDEARPPLLLVGFDRIQPVQRRLLEAWGEWQQDKPGERAEEIHSYEVEDEAAERAACARWCRARLEADPEARLLVVAQNLVHQRGLIERSFLRHCGPRFEFSLGVPLAQTTMARSALLLLRWLRQPIAEHELDWLISTGHTAADPTETDALARAMRRLRKSGSERARWTLDDFARDGHDADLLAEWYERIFAARTLLEEYGRGTRSPMAWSELVPRLLVAAGWPGTRKLSSSEFQNHRALLQALDAAASLGFDGKRLDWSSYQSRLGSVLHETLFAAESDNAPILIAGPTETAGLTADGIWFLGASEEGWPATAPLHPLLPVGVARDAEMPHALPQLDWKLGDAITRRLLAASPSICISYARQKDGVEARPSRLIAQYVGAPHPLPAALRTEPIAAPATEFFEDHAQIPFPPQNTAGGSNVLTYQSLCPFKAFATARLGAQGWQPAEAGLSAAQRGTLLHAVLHAVWSGPPHGLRTQQELLRLDDRQAFVAQQVERVFAAHLPPAAHQMPRRYLELEQVRLTRLVTEWLDFEATRIDFVVEATELKSTPHIDTLALDLRLDRIDRLNDGSLLVVDYKSGDVSPKSWELPRPEDAQLPLYAGFGLAPDDALGGLVFAKVRAGRCEFAGRVGNARETLLPTLGAAQALVKIPFTVELLFDWREALTQLARDFLAGRAEVDPREAPKTCTYCELAALCRIHENHAPDAQEEDAEEDADA
jgi:ATP-dependent helicase/nuclease subunit B